ncbi:MAG: SAM-dependent methyltransferase [Gammaproteobacteria bacterium]|nr:class I SAM-dependent methyltransferase [Rhodocyclaceae bacterium]MBU3907803.1 SAM-dependent methyltransferase [Gammaproteobacteria bacterium]MBU3990856.1 SAM-dependent methyltransferase [Gammaproteobacteria bacterium]MBU4004449.1 SAM-dependent methyltransferase [Gammaproteobacteria bacterium]MBU4019858.1 SAM-dependent methyltransferase [Gammaproteobacteria bacterium]
MPTSARPAANFPEANLPIPSADAQAASQELSRRIAARIAAAGGWLPFVDYMDMALHLPGLGYYAGGSHKFGAAGDFVTAPELTPLFGQALAAQVAEVLAAVPPASTLLEVGAGSGRLAADLLLALEALGALPERYGILELSGELRARQQATLAASAPHLAGRVDWLEELPEHFCGCVVANELIDAFPTHAVAWRETGPQERGVVLTEDGFCWAERPATGALAAAMAALPVSAPYESEINLAARAWVAEWGHRLERGALLLIDYGLPRHELYHQERNHGTLRCHYRHRAHDNLFWWPGLADITSHVDFTAVAEAGFEAGLEVLGYTNQANFLINCGIGELLAARQEAGGEQALRASGALKVLLAPGEMGELFKVIALGRGIETPLAGFARGDRCHAL